MVGAQDDRLMRMLKRTSKHHQPARLAAAIALGLVVGLVPKANLLAVGLYAALLLLPIHTSLALVVSLLVACVASLVDPISGAVGGWLLQRPLLARLWYVLDNTAVLPWLGLHNTVVLGSLVGGVALSVPTYFLSLSFFARQRRAADIGIRQADEGTIHLPQARAAAAIVPASVHCQPSQDLSADDSCETIDLKHNDSMVPAEAFRPISEVAGTVHSWHPGQSAEQSLQPRMMTTGSTPSDLAASANLAAVPSRLAHSIGGAGPEDFLPRPFTPPPRPWDDERSEVVDSLDLAHNASEVLDWVDDMLNECLTERGAQSGDLTESPSTIQGLASNSSVPLTLPRQNVDGSGTSDDSNSSEEHWLMETTIEIVRWGDDSPQALPTTVPPQGTVEEQVRSTCEPTASQADSSAPTLEPTVSFPGARKPLPRTVDLREAYRSALERGRPSIVQFIQPGAQGTKPAQTDGNSQDVEAGDPPRGECLGFLLGHLRQEREGRSS